jgi:hypothetical protein
LCAGGGIHPQLCPYSVLTDKEKKREREKAQELLRFMQMHGFRIMRRVFQYICFVARDHFRQICSSELEGGQSRKPGQRHSKEGQDASGGASGTDKRFAYSLLEKLLEYVDKAAYNMKKTQPATKWSRRKSFSTATEDVKFFGKVVLPLVEKYFRAHSDYFITNPNLTLTSGTASLKEKEMTCRFATIMQTYKSVRDHRCVFLVSSRSWLSFCVKESQRLDMTSASQYVVCKLSSRPSTPGSPPS